MSTSVELWNQAMVKIGADRITAAGLDEDAQVEAQLAATIYATEKRGMLRSYAWNCATKRAKLALIAEAPLNQFAYAYALPADNLRLIELRSGNRQLRNLNGDGVPAYVIEGGSVLTNDTNIIAKYIADIDEVFFDPHVTEALVAKLAFESIFAIGRSASAQSNFGQIYEGKLNEARITDALENPHLIIKTNQLEEVRY